MINRNVISVTVTRVTAEKKEKPYFSRVVEDTQSIDTNVILQALRMLFRGDMFKITIEAYGEWNDNKAGLHLLRYYYSFIPFGKLHISLWTCKLLTKVITKMENYVVINGERHDLVVTEGCECSDCSIYERCRYGSWVCEVFDKNPVTGYDGYHFIKHQNN